MNTEGRCRLSMTPWEEGGALFPDAALNPRRCLIRSKATLAPEHMSEEQLWSYVRSRLSTFRMDLEAGAERWKLIGEIEPVLAAVKELERRGSQGVLALFPANGAPRTPSWRDGLA